MNAITEGSASPMEGDFYNGVASFSWTAPSGNFDIDFYEVSVFVTGATTPVVVFNTTSTSGTATYPGTVMTTARVGIVVISRCGVRSEPFMTNDVSPALSGSESYCII